MNKAIIISVLAIGSAILLSPKIIGTNAHHNLTSLVSEIDGKSGYSLALKDEKMGWFGSDNTLHFSMDLTQLIPNLTSQQRQQLSQNNIETLSFDIDLTLQFGPFLGTEGVGLIAWHAQIDDRPENLTIVDEDVGFLYQMRGKAILSGDISYTDTIPAFEVASAELDGLFTVSGWQGNAVPVDGDIQYTGTLNSLTFTSNSQKVKLDNLTLDWLGEFDLATLTNQHYGKFETAIAIHSLTLQETDETMVALHDFSLFGDTKVEENEILDMAFGYSLKRLITPFDSFENIQLGFALNNISGEFVRQYQQILFDMHNQPNPEFILTALEKPFVAALVAKPEFHVTKIGFEHSAGNLISNASVKLSDYDISVEELAAENFWLNNLLVDGSVSLPKTLYRDLGKKILISRYRHDPGTAGMSATELHNAADQAIEVMLQDMVQQGLLREDGELLRLKVNVAAGEALLNGSPMPLAALSASQ